VSAPGGIAATLHRREAGSGEAVLLLHGLGGDHTVWNAQIGPLGERYRVLAPDLRGHGRSPTPDGSTFAFDELEQDLEALLDRDGVRSAHVIGLSAGGFLALQWALDRPDRVLSLGLLGTAAQCDGHTRAIVQHWGEVYRDQGYEAYVMRLLKDLYHAEWLEEHLDIVDQALETMRHQDLRAAVQWGMAVRNFDLRPKIGQIRVPTRVAHGMDDRVIDASHARFLRQAIPGTELKLFPYTGHMIPVERAEDATRLLLDWLGRTPGPGPGPIGANPASP
jgi:pimeloyl-ACP methyl ester carboxylesterase